MKISSGAPWEDLVGYSRAIRKGNSIEVSGTVSVKDGKPFGQGDVYLQTKRALEIIIKAIEEAGGSKKDIVRTRVYLVDAKHWQEAGRAHLEMLDAVRPASSMIVLKALISPEFLVEIEASAIVSIND